MNIILCGMMGAGKTTVGIKLSDLTGMRWYDTDDLITQKYGKISGQRYQICLKCKQKSKKCREEVRKCIKN